MSSKEGKQGSVVDDDIKHPTDTAAFSGRMSDTASSKFVSPQSPSSSSSSKSSSMTHTPSLASSTTNLLGELGDSDHCDSLHDHLENGSDFSDAKTYPSDRSPPSHNVPEGISHFADIHAINKHHYSQNDDAHLPTLPSVSYPQSRRWSSPQRSPEDLFVHQLSQAGLAPKTTPIYTTDAADDKAIVSCVSTIFHLGEGMKSDQINDHATTIDYNDHTAVKKVDGSNPLTNTLHTPNDPDFMKDTRGNRSKTEKISPAVSTSSSSIKFSSPEEVSSLLSLTPSAPISCISPSLCFSSVPSFSPPSFTSYPLPLPPPNSSLRTNVLSWSSSPSKSPLPGISSSSTFSSLPLPSFPSSSSSASSSSPASSSLSSSGSPSSPPSSFPGSSLSQSSSVLRKSMPSSSTAASLFPQSYAPSLSIATSTVAPLQTIEKPENDPSSQNMMWTDGRQVWKNQGEDVIDASTISSIEGEDESHDEIDFKVENDVPRHSSSGYGVAMDSDSTSIIDNDDTAHGGAENVDGWISSLWSSIKSCRPPTIIYSSVSGRASSVPRERPSFSSPLSCSPVNSIQSVKYSYIGRDCQGEYEEREDDDGDEDYGESRIDSSRGAYGHSNESFSHSPSSKIRCWINSLFNTNEGFSPLPSSSKQKNKATSSHANVTDDVVDISYDNDYDVEAERHAYRPSFPSYSHPAIDEYDEDDDERLTSVFSVTVKNPSSLSHLLALFYSFSPIAIFIFLLVWFILSNAFAPLFSMCLVGFASLLNEICLKNYFKQPRPLGSAVNSYGMPSSHCMTSFALLTWVLLESMDLSLHQVMVMNDHYNDDVSPIKSTANIGFSGDSDEIDTMGTNRIDNFRSGNDDHDGRTDRIEALFQPLLLFILLGPVPWARVALKDHSVLQCTVGCVGGIIIGFIAFLIRRFILYPSFHI